MIVDVKSRRYTTRGGLDVELHDDVPFNSAGHRVTFPIKGSIVRITRTGRRKPEFNIWRSDGRLSIFRETDDDLIEIK